ncbi:MAG: molybdate ABC transporter substrate-binding protein [Actinomycetota bacterium]|nr:molybdate ABC transporter substrate-binding protein [Actinomycetota bacterium]MDQ3680453.1 molybdate ABC transporter substrate-binding protein [Actinomycetota bacterium]
MTGRTHLVGATMLLLAVTSLLACGEGGDTKSPMAVGGNQTSRLSGPLTVFAAASLTEALNDLKAQLAAEHPDLNLTYVFAGSQTLVTQLEQGGPGDVFASADDKNMQRAAGAGLVEQARTFARNKLEIAVAPGNPKNVRGLEDLARPDLVVVLEDPSVPAGDYTRQALSRAGVTVKAKSLELDVKAALAKVTSGEADAAVVYVTDVKAAGRKVTGVPIPDDQNVVASYPIAVTRASGTRDAARAFVDEVVTGKGQQVLMNHGFLPAA